MRKILSALLIACLLFQPPAFAAFRKSKPWGLQKPSLGTQIDRNNPLSRGLVGAWIFNENAGNNLLDSSGIVNATLATGSWGNFFRGSAISFDGLNTIITVNKSSKLDNLGAQTMMGWFYAIDGGEGVLGRFFDKRTSADAQCTLAFLGSSGSSRINFSRSTTGVAYAIQTNNNITTNVWQHIAITWTGVLATGNGHIYINGVDQSLLTDTAGTGSLLDDSGGVLYLGNRTAKDRTWHGSFGYFLMYNRALSQSEVIQDYVQSYSFFQTPKMYFVQPSSGVVVTNPNSQLMLMGLGDIIYKNKWEWSQ